MSTLLVNTDWQALATQLILIAAALTAVGTLVKYLRVGCRELKEFRDEYRARRQESEQDRKLLHELSAEFKPNGGSSMKDALNRVEHGLEIANRNIGLIGQRQLQMYNLGETGIWETDAAGLCTYVNPAMAALAGCVMTDFIGTGWKNLIHPDDRESVSRAWEAAVRDKRDFMLDFRYRRPDGTAVPVHVSGKRMFGPDGHILGWIGDCHRQREGNL